MKHPWRIAANALTLFRMGAVPIAVWMLIADKRGAAVVLMLLMLLSDALDGWAARKAPPPASYGERLDVLADRAVEWTFWIYFGVEGSLPLWVAAVVIVRTTSTDILLRYRLPSWKRRWRDPVWSRGGYALVKTSAAALLALGFLTAGRWLAYASVIICLARAVPTLAGLARRLKSPDSPS